MVVPDIPCAALREVYQLLESRFETLVDLALRDSIVNDVGSIIRVWSSADVALDKQHAPFIYSRFLSSLLSYYTDGGNRSIGVPSRMPPTMSWIKTPRSASPRGYDAGPSGYQTLFDADPSQFVQASSERDAFSFHNFVSNVKTAQSGWPASSELSYLAPSYDPQGHPSSWFAAPP